MTEIDLSNFQTGSVTSMQYMFCECTNLISINFGNMDTSKVENMEGIFMYCTKIKSFDFSKFDTSSLTHAKYMFKNCESVESLDLTNFKTTKLKNMFDMFCNCYKLLSVNISNFDTSNVENMRGTFFGCLRIKYIDIQNFKATSLNNLIYTFSYCYDLIYLNMRNFRIPNVNNVQLFDTFIRIPSTTKYCIQDVNTKEYLIGNITSNCSDLCFQENVIIDQYNKRCICNENYKFEYNSQCYKNCPNSLLQIKTDKYICSSTAPRNYYLDNDDNIYKQCYTICKQCSKAGNSSNHNCDVCEEGYTFINDTVATKNNCYQICSIYYYFYFNSYSNKYYYYCVNTCPTTYNKIIEPKKRCIDDCKKDEEYIYEYNNKCYKVCPIN